MNKYFKYTFALALPMVVLSSCDDYLDTMPDNRATVDSELKIKSMLVSAYPTAEYASVCELSSDNCDDSGPQNPYTDRWLDDTFAWKDESESSNFSLDSYWEKSYGAIASANQALDAIEQLGGEKASVTLAELKGEALMCRAYNHFMLANLFCKNWSSNAASDLGLPYMDHSETELLPKYERGNLADFYDKIQADIEEGVELVGDSYYDVPKYHFTPKAAYAFATRFYLYTEQWDKAIDAANKCLGSQPQTLLRDWSIFISFSPDADNLRQNAYISTTEDANLLITTAYSNLGWMFGRWYVGTRYNHLSATAAEDLLATNVFGSLKTGLVSRYSGTNFNKVLIVKNPYLFEYTDPAAGIGYRHAVVVNFTVEEVLLSRAEAYIMTNRFDEAAADLTLWARNIANSMSSDLTPASITNFYNRYDYAYSDASGLNSSIKKHLNPAFAIDVEGSTQECMLQCVLGFRRIESMHNGLRWFDIKRYGIEIPRRVCNAAGNPAEVTDVLTKDDLRRAFQIPQKVRDAELATNPRS